VETLHQALTRQLLEIAMHGDRAHVVLVRELGERGAARLLDVLQDASATLGGRHGAVG
jgi:hypothetical protein